MCTGFVKKGRDMLFGFNLDIDPAAWDYALYKTADYFTVGIKIGNTLYFTHGVSKEGHFGNLPFCNDFEHGKFSAIRQSERIDLLTDRYIRNRYSYADVVNILNTKAIINAPECSMHTLLADGSGHVLLIEPGSGYKEIIAPYAVISNYPLLSEVAHFEPFFGKDRYDRACEILAASDDGFSPLDGLDLLREVKAEGKWATRVSFVYSANENCVYYCLDRHFDRVGKHCFGPCPEQSRAAAAAATD